MELRVTTGQVRRNFEKGLYQEAIRIAEDGIRTSRALNAEGMTYYIGSLSFSGRIEDAERLQTESVQGLSGGLEIRTRFFLVIAFCRQSRYAEAKKLLLQNLKQRRILRKRRTLEAMDEFFVRQGVAFYRYFQASYLRALRQTQLAQRAAFKSGSDYALVLAQDLRGHIHAQFHEIEEALKDLRQSSGRARAMGMDSLSAASEISQLIYQAEQGLDPEAIQTLTNALQTLSSNDTYSKSNLRLELARQLFWRGQLNEALAVLDQASRTIHETRNRRQEALLNLRYADTHLLAGRTERALTHIRFAQHCFTLNHLHLSVSEAEPTDRADERVNPNERFDLDIVLKVAATERRIQIALGQSTVAVDEEILKIRNWTGLPSDFDPQERLLNEISQDIDDQNRLARNRGLHSFFHLPQIQDRNSRLIILDLFPGTLFTSHQGETRLKKGLAPLIRKTLTALSNGICTKRQLIETIWGYDYDATRHDALIYSTFATLRRLLDERGHWVETFDHGYGLAKNVQLVSHGPPLATLLKNKKSNLSAADEGPSLVSQLNHRQLDILKILRKKNYLTTAICMKLFSVSEITASRDLSQLMKLRLVCRIGRGRAVRYCLFAPVLLREENP